MDGNTNTGKDIEMKRPNYIKNAIAWNGRIGENGAWVRISDMNYIVDGKKGYWTLPFSWPVWAFHHVYPYEDWMEEYVGTCKILFDDERFEDYDD